MPKLTDLNVEWVSLVNRAAVRDPANPAEPQRFLLFKAEGAPDPNHNGGTMTLTTEELTAAVTKAEEERDAATQAAQKAETERAELAKRVEELEKAAGESKPDPAKPEPAPVDKADLPEAARLAIEKAEAENAETRKRLEKAEADATAAQDLAKSERDQRLEREFIAKAQGDYDALAFDADAVGPALKRASEALSAEDYAQITSVLKAANEQAGTGKLFAELGRSGDAPGTSDAGEALSKAAEEIKKNDPSLSHFEALERARRANPQAQADYLSRARG